MIKPAQGFMIHFAHPAGGEIWESKEDADRWFVQYVVPNLPEGIHSKRSYHELHSVVHSNAVEMGIARFFNFMSGG